MEYDTSFGCRQVVRFEVKMLVHIPLGLELFLLGLELVLPLCSL